MWEVKNGNIIGVTSLASSCAVFVITASEEVE